MAIVERSSCLNTLVRTVTLGRYGVEKRLVDFVWRRRPGSGRIVRDREEIMKLPSTHMDPLYKNRIVRNK